MAFPSVNPPPQPSFFPSPPHPASEYPGVAVLAVLEVGAGHVALNPILTISASRQECEQPSYPG